MIPDSSDTITHKSASTKILPETRFMSLLHVILPMVWLYIYARVYVYSTALCHDRHKHLAGASQSRPLPHP